jgi:hypothetical protein
MWDKKVEKEKENYIGHWVRPSRLSLVIRALQITGKYGHSNTNV